jgi:hypothetical protein
MGLEAGSPSAGLARRRPRRYHGRPLSGRAAGERELAAPRGRRSGRRHPFLECEPDAARASAGAGGPKQGRGRQERERARHLGGARLEQLPGRCAAAAHSQLAPAAAISCVEGRIERRDRGGARCRCRRCPRRRRCRRRRRRRLRL